MTINYDMEADAKYISLLKAKTQKKGVVARTKKITDWLLTDYSSTGQLIGIEILNASKNDGIVSILDTMLFYSPVISKNTDSNLPVPTETFDRKLSKTVNALV